MWGEGSSRVRETLELLSHDPGGEVIVPREIKGVELIDPVACCRMGNSHGEVLILVFGVESWGGAREEFFWKV